MWPPASAVEQLPTARVDLHCHTALSFYTTVLGDPSTPEGLRQALRGVFQIDGV